MYLHYFRDYPNCTIIPYDTSLSLGRSKKSLPLIFEKANKIVINDNINSNDNNGKHIHEKNTYTDIVNVEVKKLNVEMRKQFSLNLIRLNWKLFDVRYN